MQHIKIVFIAVVSLGWLLPQKASPIAVVEVPLEVFVEKVIIVCKTRLSEIKKTMLIEQLVRVTNKEFSERTHKEAFISLVCIESKFNSQARSKAGAIGYSQVLSKYAQSFSDTCKYGKVTEKDLYDPEINLKLGACFFHSLLKMYDGNIALGLAGYNSGPKSVTTLSLQKLEIGEDSQKETMGYISKFYTLQQQVASK